jgi:hypothetical protein
MPNAVRPVHFFSVEFPFSAMFRGTYITPSRKFPFPDRRFQLPASKEKV